MGRAGQAALKGLFLGFGWDFIVSPLESDEIVKTALEKCWLGVLWDGYAKGEQGGFPDLGVEKQWSGEAGIGIRLTAKMIA